MLEQSLKILEQALNAASKSGVYTLQESATIFQALATVTVALTPKEDSVGETPKTKSK